MESLFRHINESPISANRLMTILSGFIFMNPIKAQIIMRSDNIYQCMDLYKDKGIICPSYSLQYRISYFIKDRIFIHSVYGDLVLNKMLFVVNNRCVFVDNNYKLSFFELLTDMAFFEIIDELMIRPNTGADFMRNNSLFEEIKNVDIHWVTKRHNTKSARGYAEPLTACS